MERGTGAVRVEDKELVGQRIGQTTLLLYLVRHYGYKLSYYSSYIYMYRRLCILSLNFNIGRYFLYLVLALRVHDDAIFCWNFQLSPLTLAWSQPK